MQPRGRYKFSAKALNDLVVRLRYVRTRPVAVAIVFGRSAQTVGREGCLTVRREPFIVVCRTQEAHVEAGANVGGCPR